MDEPNAVLPSGDTPVLFGSETVRSMSDSRLRYLRDKNVYFSGYGQGTLKLLLQEYTLKSKGFDRTDEPSKLVQRFHLGWRRP